jgi:hypothetical protein
VTNKKFEKITIASSFFVIVFGIFYLFEPLPDFPGSSREGKQ